MPQRETVFVHFPINVWQGRSEIWFVTSPIVPGLFIAAPDRDEAIRSVEPALVELAAAHDKEKR